MNDVYKPADTMLQYIELFNMLRKTVGSNVATLSVSTPNVTSLPSTQTAGMHPQQYAGK